MMVMLANRCGIEIGYLAARFPGLVGHLYSPGAQCGPYPFMPYALDNGAFIAWKHKRAWPEDEWRFMLRWAALSGQRPLWCIVPDVVADRAATLANWDRYAEEIRGFGFRPALAVQDGMTFDDVPDSDCMLFLGGSTEWKEGAIAPWCERFPDRVHVGRVNKWRRLMMCYRAGAVSVDGTGWFHKKGGQAADLVRFLEFAQTEQGGLRAVSGY